VPPVPMPPQGTALEWRQLMRRVVPPPMQMPEISMLPLSTYVTAEAPPPPHTGDSGVHYPPSKQMGSSDVIFITGFLLHHQYHA
jgi:hypothetical protein